MPSSFLSSFFTLWQFSDFEGIGGFLEVGEFGLVGENAFHLELLEFTLYVGSEYKRSKAKS